MVASDDGHRTTSIDNPILNSPYEEPDRHYEVGQNGPTGVIKDGRRPSESWIPIAMARKGKKGEPVQETIDFDVTGERRERNELINEIRRDVAKWRSDGQYGGVTPITRKLLQHWADKDRENRVIFAQRDAAETAIFLTEVAGRHHGYADWRRRLEPENEAHNDRLPRAALKMATGGGKTVVMAMLIAWQTLNKVQSPRDARFTNRFLVVTPGLTIRDRLRVLLPEDAENYYDLRDLIPADLKGSLEHARIAITNYHAFQLKDAKEIRGVAKNTRLLLKGDRKDDPFKETPQAMVSRILRDLGPDKQQIMVLNDEAHHCYADRPLQGGEKADKEQQDANEQARVWFRGLQAIAKHAGTKQIWDLSATPFYLKGSGYNEGYIFPWTVSDFSLMDAIESGIVKVPRTPVDDDAADPLVTYLRLWDYVGPELPKRAAKDAVTDWLPPKELEGALRSLHRSYEKAFAHWEKELAQHGETPPVEAGQRLAAAGRRALWRDDDRAAAGLLGRALALIRPLRLEINLELDLAEAQQTPEAQAAIADHAARRAREIGDRAAETIALLVAAKTQLEAAPQPDVIDDLERLGKEALDLLEPGTDDAARGRVWYALAEAANYRGQFEKRALAAEQALRCFELSRAHHFELAGLPWALIQGPRAADEALETLEPFLAANPAPYALFGRAHLLAMLNRFDEAWELVLPISDRQRELSEGPELDIQLGDIAALGGDYKLAIRHLRQACNTLERLGMNAHLSSYAPLLGRCLCELGRYGDAEPFALLGRDLGAEQDLTTQTYWRQVQARVHASRGDHAEAERLAREAVSISERTDGLNLQADAHCDLADVLAQAGKPGEASEALDQALERYKRKQNLAMIAQVQPRRDALQDELAAHGSTGTP